MVGQPVPPVKETCRKKGRQTGLAIGFDEWFSGGSDTVEGMSVRIDNQIKAMRFAFPTSEMVRLTNDRRHCKPYLEDGTTIGVFDDELQDLQWVSPEARARVLCRR